VKRPVLILGWLPRVVVPIARALHRHGITVDQANFVLAMNAHSGSIREFRHIPRPDLSRDGFLQGLQSFIQDGNHEIVIPTDDQTLIALADHYDHIRQWTRVACPPPEVVRRVLNKAVTLETARQCGIAVPATEIVASSDELMLSGSQLAYPRVLKPAGKEVRIAEVKSYIFETPSDVTQAFPSPKHFHLPMLLQEYCPGYGVGIEMLMHKGNCLAVFQHRRVQEHPYTGGVSVTAIAEKPDAVLVHNSLTLLRALEWEGPAMVEFKINPKTGVAVLMEVNGRYWGTIGLALAAGVNFPLYHWQILQGENSSVPETYRIGTRWRWTVGHLGRFHSLITEAPRSRQARRELAVSLAKLPLSFGPAVHGLFDWRDPVPAISEIVHALKFLAWYDYHAVMRRVSNHAEC